jgi:hypothetical protein
MAPRKKIEEVPEVEQSAAVVSGRLPVWEGGETRSQYLARCHQYRLDHDLPGSV